MTELSHQKIGLKFYINHDGHVFCPSMRLIHPDEKTFAALLDFSWYRKFHVWLISSTSNLKKWRDILRRQEIKIHLCDNDEIRNSVSLLQNPVFICWVISWNYILFSHIFISICWGLSLTSKIILVKHHLHSHYDYVFRLINMLYGGSDLQQWFTQADFR